MKKIYIDHLRTAATAAVVMIHVTGSVYAQFGRIDQFGWWIANILNAASRFAVPVFVMISGAVLLGKPVTAGKFYRKRAVRLLPPLIFWNIIYILFKLWLGMDKEALLRLLTAEIWTEGKAYVHLWYLTMFLCLMLFAPFINKFILGERPTSRDFVLFFAIAASFFLLDTLSDMTRELKGMSMYWHLAVKWYIAYFIIGYAIDRYGVSINIGSKTNALLLITIIFLGAALNYIMADRFGKIQDYLVMSNTGIVTFIFAALLFLFYRKNLLFSRECRAVSIVSENSFGVYLVHPLILNRISAAAERYSFPAYEYIAILFASTFLISIFIVAVMRKSALLRKIC